MSEVAEPRIDGAPSPSTEEDLAAYCRVDWARPGIPLRALCLVDRPCGFYLHWRKGGNRLCPRSWDPEAECALCVEPVDKRVWYAAILGHCLRTADTILFLLPDHSYARARRRLERSSLAGRIVSGTRVHSHATVTVEITEVSRAASVVAITPERFRGIIERVYSRMGHRTPKGEVK